MQKTNFCASPAPLRVEKKISQKYVTLIEHFITSYIDVVTSCFLKHGKYLKSVSAT